MCKVAHVHYTCGHIRTMEEECAVAVEADIPFWIKSFCEDYSVSNDHADRKKCGAGEFYCKMNPDGEYLDQICVEFNDLKPNLQFWNNRIKSITTYAERLKKNGIEAMQAGHAVPAPSKELTKRNHDYARWNRALVLQKLTSLSNILNSARDYFINYDQQQAAGLEITGPAFMVGDESQPRVPTEVATFAATRSFPSVFAGTGAVPIQPAQATRSVVASDFGPTMARFGADEPHAPAVAHHALATINQPTPTNDQAASLSRQRALKYAQTLRSPRTTSTTQRGTAPILDLTEETPTKASQPKGSQRKRKAQTAAEEHPKVRRSTRVAKKKVNYAEDQGSEGWCAQVVVSLTGKNLLMTDAMPASTTSSSPQKPVNPSPLRQSSVADAEPSPLRGRNQATNLQYHLGNYERQFTGLNTVSPAIDSELSPKRRDSVYPNLISGSAALNSKLQQARSNSPSANTMQALSTLYMQQAGNNSLVGRPLSTANANQASGPLNNVGMPLYSASTWYPASATTDSATTDSATTPGTTPTTTAPNQHTFYNTLSALPRPVPTETRRQDYASLRRSFSSGLALPPISSSPLPNPVAPATDPSKPVAAASSPLIGAKRPAFGLSVQSAVQVCHTGGVPAQMLAHTAVDGGVRYGSADFGQGTADTVAADGSAGNSAAGVGMGDGEDDRVDWSMLDEGAWEE